MVIRLGPVRKTKLVLDRELIQDFKMVDVLLIHFSTDLGIFQETSRYLCPYLLNYPIATRIVHSRVVKKDFSACHPTSRFWLKFPVSLHLFLRDIFPARNYSSFSIVWVMSQMNQTYDH